jgi:hypothetical protein
MQFVENMNKWLANRELKKEFLSNLRKKFAVDTTLLREAIERQSTVLKGKEPV